MEYKLESWAIALSTSVVLLREKGTVSWSPPWKLTLCPAELRCLTINIPDSSSWWKRAEETHRTVARDSLYRWKHTKRDQSVARVRISLFRSKPAWWRRGEVRQPDVVKHYLWLCTHWGQTRVRSETLNWWKYGVTVPLLRWVQLICIPTYPVASLLQSLCESSTWTQISWDGLPSAVFLSHFLG